MHASTAQSSQQTNRNAKYQCLEPVEQLTPKLGALIPRNTSFKHQSLERRSSQPTRAKCRHQQRSQQLQESQSSPLPTYHGRIKYLELFQKKKKRCKNLNAFSNCVIRNIGMYLPLHLRLHLSLFFLFSPFLLFISVLLILISFLQIQVPHGPLAVPLASRSQIARGCSPSGSPKFPWEKICESTLFSFMFLHFLSISLIFFHILSLFFHYFSFLSFSFVQFLSFSFIF